MRPGPILFAALAIIAAAPVDAHAQDAGCKLQKVVEWQVRSIGRHMAVDGAINGRKIGLVLDTGASTSMLFRASAVRLGLDLKESRGERAFGVGGETQVYTALVDEFKLGEAVVRDLQFKVSGGPDKGAEGFDLLLGEDFLRHFDVEFDLAHELVRLWQPKDCSGASLAYWTTAVAGEVTIEEMRDAHPKIAFTVQLNGKPVHTELDSGASMSIVPMHEADALGVKQAGPAAFTSGVGPKTIEMWPGKFATFAIGNEDIADIEILVSDLYRNATYQGPGSRIARNAFETQPMLLGADFLRSHRTLVSHSQKKMYFTYVGGQVFATGPSRTVAPPPVKEKAAN